MAEPLYLDMSPKKQGLRVGTGRHLLWSLTGSAVLLVLGVCFWLFIGRVESRYGLLEGMVHTVAPEWSGRLEVLFVKEGDVVSAGQAVARMDMKDHARHLEQAGREVAALRPPDMPEMDARLQEARRAEKAMVENLARLRYEEEKLRDIREDQVTAHVRALLALRSLESQGGEQVVGRTALTEARKAEVDARIAKDKAGTAFEEASRMRAATERELNRIRDEVQLARDLASQNRYAQSQQKTTQSFDVPDGTLYAPVSGRVLVHSTRTGQILGSGEPVLLIAPNGTSDEHRYWVQAYFSTEEGKSIQAGQRCMLRFTGKDISMFGSVQSVGGPAPLSSGMPDGEAASSDPAKEPGLFIPVRIAVDGDVPQGIEIGSKVTCTVATHSVLGISALF